jgi:hypothetical protein
MVGWDKDDKASMAPRLLLLFGLEILLPAKLSSSMYEYLTIFA